ncbi:hypothetical protein PBV87_12870 [Niameybacter massiliensis]|uniref:Head decoration protein n=1 Tax=Holtiella tumoricola TaxID=3018743 RepID=A0AA42DPD4_9FIRM|nr:hypothetical protein [Holtiella tumoricola]MDA3732381.1 hypothetical protein [Holtiella tumoricola]
MSRKAFQKVGEFTPDKLIAGNTHPIDTKGVEIATGSGVLVRGTLINATGTMCTATSDVPVGILCDDVTQNSSGTTAALMYISGDFKASEITVGDDVTVTSFELELQKLGIFLK